MANSTRCAACGRTACDCSLLNEWRFPDSRRPNVPSDGRVAIVPLQRTAHYLSSCAIAEVNPDKFGCFTPGTKIPIVSEAEAKAVAEEASKKLLANAVMEYFEIEIVQ